jgi:3-oxoacyl-[acyl-carrier-protein] synthase-3
MTKITAAITAVGMYVPEYVLTNNELESYGETNDEWITCRRGI